MSHQSPQAPWRTSSYSSGANNCVEVAQLPAAAAIRDTKHRHLAALVFPTAEWNAFLTEVKADRV